METWWMGLAACALMLAPGLTTAGDDARPPTMQASMLLTGSVVVKPDGTVASYVIDRLDKVLPGARAELAKVIPQWKFQPAMQDGKAVEAKSPMGLRLVAKPAGNGMYNVTVASAYFGGAGLPGAVTTLRYAKNHHRVVPRFPRLALGAAGTVYVLARVGPDGTVQRIAVEQVDLYTRGSPTQLKQWRQAFGAASVEAIRRWKFDVPTAGPSVGRSHWEARIPVVFSATRQRRVAYGHWKSYLPGPEQFIPWADKNLIAQGGADAVPADGGLYPAQQTLHLLSSPGAH